MDGVNDSEVLVYLCHKNKTISSQKVAQNSNVFDKNFK
jgi:hypothetical protein